MQTVHPDIEAARAKLEACRGQWEDVASASGVSYSWLSKFANGHIENPGANTLQRVMVACDDVSAILAQLPSRQAAN